MFSGSFASWVSLIFFFLICFNCATQVSGLVPYINVLSAWQHGPFYPFYAIILLRKQTPREPCWRDLMICLRILKGNDRIALRLQSSISCVVISNLVLPVIPSTGCGHKILSDLFFSKEPVGTFRLFFCRYARHNAIFLSHSNEEGYLLLSYMLFR